MPDTPEADYSPTETILAIDFGLRRIGVAVGQTITGSASPLRVVSNGDRGPDFDSISALIDEWQPARLIVGLPLHADGSPGEMQSHVEEFVRELWRYQLPIDTVDERYTSLEAEAALKNARAAGSKGRISKEAIDSAAAVFIAERYLASRLSAAGY
jgi:putative Holliday junction resolvase